MLIKFGHKFIQLDAIAEDIVGQLVPYTGTAHVPCTIANFRSGSTKCAEGDHIER